MIALLFVSVPGVVAAQTEGTGTGDGAGVSTAGTDSDADATTASEAGSAPEEGAAAAGESADSADGDGGASDAPKKSVNEQILDLLRESGQITEERYGELKAQEQAERASYEQQSAALKYELDGLHFVHPGTKIASVILNGRIHADYWGFPCTNDGAAELEGERPQNRFGFRRVRFGVKGDILEYMPYKIEMEFADPDDFEWRDVHIGFKTIPYVQTLLVGNQKRPYGLDHLNSSRYNTFMERPMFIDAFNDDARRLGIEAYGVSDSEMFNWRYGVFNGDKVQDSDALYTSNNMQGEIAGRFASTLWYPEEREGKDYLHLGVSGTVAFPDGSTDPRAANTARFRARPEARSIERWVNTDFIDTAETCELLGFEAVFNKGPFSLTGEWQNVWTQRDVGSSLHFWGAYGQVAYWLTGDYSPWSRKSGTLGRTKPIQGLYSIKDDEWGWGAWQVALRYSYSDMSNGDILGGVGQNITLSLNWWFNPNSRLQFNYIHGEIDESQTLIDAGGDQVARYDIVGARFMVDF